MYVCVVGAFARSKVEQGPAISAARRFQGSGSGRKSVRSFQAQEAAVPERPGEYGDRVRAVEPGGIEVIPARDRHGRPLDLFWTWVSPNMQFSALYVGVLPIAVFGGGFRPTAVGLVIGSALGSLTMGILASWGPRFGVAQMVESRGAFGYVGNLLPAGLNAFTTGVGWFVVNSVAGAFALSTLIGISFQLGYAIVVVAQVTVAFVGHNLVHYCQRLVFPVVTIVFAIATVVVFTKAHFSLGFNDKAPAALGGSSAAFSFALFVAFGYAVGWNPCSSDYTRYLPATVDARRVGLATGLGLFVSCVWMQVLGAAVATLGGSDPNPTANFTHPLGQVVGDAALVAIVIGGVAANVLNIYSGAMSFLTLGIRLPLRIGRAGVALASGALGLGIGLAFRAEVGPGSRYENFLLAITYWIGPWLAVVLVDYWLRRGQYRVHDFYDRSRNNWEGVVAMLAGIAASYPFWDQSQPFLGVVPRHYPEMGDLSFLVGGTVSGLLYLGFRALPARGYGRRVPRLEAGE